MAKKCFNITKISRPDISQISFRQRLFERLTESAKFPLTWVSGPPGSGKTACVSSFIGAQEAPCIWYKIDSNDTDLATFFKYLAMAYQKIEPENAELPALTSELSLNLPEFSRHFFTELISRLPETFFLVFDNYQEIPEDLPLHELLLDTMNFMPERAHIIIISRKEPYSKFSRLALNRSMYHIHWHDLQFTEDEFQDVVRERGFDALPHEALAGIHGKLGGWIAGLQFMLDDKKKYNTDLQHISTSTRGEIYRYFADEVFDYQDSDIKQFLLTIAILPSVSEKYAQEITGSDKVSKILAHLHRHNFFIDKLNGATKADYQMHPLFRDYLLATLPEYYGPEEITHLKRSAAMLLANDNMVEEAASLLLAADDWDGISGIILNHAEVLREQGRIELLTHWLASIPEDVILQNPWLSYWLGISQLPEDTEAAKLHFARAFAKFCEEQDWAGSFAAWIGQVDAIISQWHNFKELDTLIEWLEKNFGDRGPNLPTDQNLQLATCMLAAMNIRRPQSAALAKWVEFCTEAAMVTKNAELSIQAYLEIANYYLWRGDQSNCWILLGKLRNLCRTANVSAMSLLKSKNLEATMYAWLLMDSAKCSATIEQALDISKRTGVRSMNHLLYATAAYAALIDKNYTLMAEYLQKIEALLDSSRRHIYFSHDYLSAWLSLFRNNFQRGSKHAKEALKTARTTGYIYHEALALFAQAQILYEKGELQSANGTLLRFKKIIEPLNSLLLQYMYFLTKARFSIEQDKVDIGLKFLRKGMKLGRDENYQRLMYWWHPKAMTNLCMYALDNDIETDYVQELINRQGLVPASSPIEIERWPWPIKIYTFGRFEIVKNSKAIRSSGKAQQKPLAMLKALICLGGRSVSEFHLANALWPDAEGDLQHQTLATTLHRLRRILGGKEMVEFNDGHVSLNPMFCWVDAWAFERLLSQAEAESQKKDKQSSFFAARYAEKAVEMYRGNFLPQNIDHWSIHKRERLKGRFLRGVNFLGRNLEKIGEREKAVVYYMRALEIDPLVEEFYQRLMICYLRMGRNADAVLVFRRCIKNFSKVLKISPSTQTKALYKNLLAKQYSPQEDDELTEKKIKYVNNL